MAYLQVRNTPVRVTAIVLAHSSSLVSATGRSSWDTQ
jgi:hypothetical protein